MSEQVTIYHNPRCSKSRKALEILEAKNIDINIYKYLDEGLTISQVGDLAQQLNLSILDFVRQKEDAFKALSIDWNNQEDAKKALSENPKILERPIVVRGDKAVVARPPEDLEKLF